MRGILIFSLVLTQFSCAAEEPSSGPRVRKSMAANVEKNPPLPTPNPVQMPAILQPNIPPVVTPNTPATAPSMETPAFNLTALNILPATLKELDVFDDKGAAKAGKGLVPYNVAAPLWSDGAAKARYVILPKGKTVIYNAMFGSTDLPPGTLLFKHFASSSMAPVETRVMLKRPNSTWEYAVYKWLADGSTKRVFEPETLPADKDWPGGYRIPAEKECQKCHTPTASETLGFRPDQLGAEVDKLVTAGVLSMETAVEWKKVVPLDNFQDTALSAEKRALSYMAVNCAPCHQPGGLMSRLPLTAKTIDFANLTKVPPVVPGKMDAPLIAPGKPEESKIYQRFTAMMKRMPSTSVVVDPVGLEIFKNWITSYQPKTPAGP